jgi:2-dehydropantoate 2-reductase
MSDDILIVGGGAIGSVIAAGLVAKGFAPVLVHARSPRPAGHVTTVTGPRWAAPLPLPEGTWRDVLPARQGQRALVFVTTKSYDLPRLAPALAAWARPGDLLTLVQNGLGVERAFEGRVHESQLARAILGFGAVVEGTQARMTFAAPHSHLGALAAQGRARAVDAAQLLSTAGFSTHATDDIEREVWRKVVLGALALVCVLDDVDIGTALARPACRALYDRLARERWLVARAAGQSFDDDFLARCRADNELAAPHLPSMVVDRRRGHPLELEHDVRAVLALARVHGVSAPANEEVAARLAVLSRGSEVAA